MDLDLAIGFLAEQVHPPYKYKGSWPIEASTLLENLSLVPVGNPRFVPVSRPVPLLLY